MPTRLRAGEGAARYEAGRRARSSTPPVALRRNLGGLQWILELVPGRRRSRAVVMCWSACWTGCWRHACCISAELTAQADVPIDVLVEQVAEQPGASGVAGLRTEGAQPHEVAFLNLDP